MKKEKNGKESSNVIDNSDETNFKYRSIKLVIKSNQTPEGDGFVVHRSFPSGSIRNLDPFLLLDEKQGMLYLLNFHLVLLLHVLRISRSPYSIVVYDHTL